MNFENILLDPHQQELLIRIAEANRNISQEQRQKFILAQTLNNGDYLIHPGLPKETKVKAYIGDIEALADEGLLSMTRGSRGSPMFDVTPLGLKYYEYLKEQAGDALGRIESTINVHLDSHNFQLKYPEAYQKWSSAEGLLWSYDNKQPLTTIGHLCREAVQEFADTLVKIHKLPDVSSDKMKTIVRIRAVLNHKSQQTGSTVKPFLEALLAYWGAVNELIQRQEHGGQKEGKSLRWEDARRVVFQTAIVMFEIDKTLI